MEQPPRKTGLRDRDTWQALPWQMLNLEMVQFRSHMVPPPTGRAAGVQSHRALGGGGMLTAPHTPAAFQPGAARHVPGHLAPPGGSGEEQGDANLMHPLQRLAPSEWAGRCPSGAELGFCQEHRDVHMVKLCG